MVQATKPQSKRVIILIVLAVLILMLGGLGYYFFFMEKPPLVYSVTVNSDKAISLRPMLRRGHPASKLRFYFRGEVFDVSQYRQVEVLNPKGISLRLLEELGDGGLIMMMKQGDKDAEQNQQIEYKEVPVLEKKLHAESAPDYFFEVEKLEKGKKYVLCEEGFEMRRSLRCFFALVRH